MITKMPLKDIIMFSKLSDQDLAEIAGALKQRRLDEGEVIFNLGDPGDELIIVEQGVLSIYVPVESKEDDIQPIRLFQAGEMLGEMSLIDQKPRSASARAEEPSTILTLKESDFRRLLRQSPELAMAVMAGLSDRIRYTTEFLSEVSGWIQRIAEGDYQAGETVRQQEFDDQTMAELAADFVQMSARVQEREEVLRKEVAQLRIEIDEAKRQQEAARIMGSDYYKELKERAKKLRARD